MLLMQRAHRAISIELKPSPKTEDEWNGAFIDVQCEATPPERPDGQIAPIDGRAPRVYNYFPSQKDLLNDPEP